MRRYLLCLQKICMLYRKNSYKFTSISNARLLLNVAATIFFMRQITAILLLCCALGCKHKSADTQKEIEQKLANAFTAFLYQGIDNDSSRIKYNVTETIYFENPNDYVCEFKVHMRTTTTDTTGMMSARISKDMQKVFRRF